MRQVEGVSDAVKFAPFSMKFCADDRDGTIRIFD